jgi:hypothetical protein
MANQSRAHSSQSHVGSTDVSEGRFTMNRIRIRRVVAKGTLDVRLANDRFYHMDKMVRDLTEEHKIVMASIRQRQRLLRKERRTSRLLPRTPRIHRFVTEKRIERRQSLKEKTEPEVPRKIFQISIRPFVAEPYEMASFSTSVSKGISKRVEQFIQTANKSAFEAYGLHIALRLRLGKMIKHRTKRDRQRKMAVGRLETRLIELRTYDEVLYSSTSVHSATRVRKKLRMLELQNQLQRSLVLSTQSGAKLRGRIPRSSRKDSGTSDNASARQREERPTLRIRYRRNQGRKMVLPSFRWRRIPRYTIRRLRCGPRHTIRRHLSYSRRVSQRPRGPRERTKLVQTVSFWLGDTPAKSAKAAQPARRPFGSRALESDDRGAVEKKEGRRRPGGRQRRLAVEI